jgi:transglutaminase-like putative cysteine protease
VTARILAVEYPGLADLPPDSLEETVRLTSLLKACGAFEGIPARYVSGYLHDDSLASEHGASHAWVDAWDGARGWVSLDPTHDREQEETYVRVATGRDYGDVPPTRGVFEGQAEEKLAVRVVVDAVG